MAVEILLRVVLEENEPQPDTNAPTPVVEAATFDVDILAAALNTADSEWSITKVMVTDEAGADRVVYDESELIVS